MLVCRVERKCPLNRSPRRLPVSPIDVNLVAGTTFDKVYHAVACTGVPGIDGDMSPRTQGRC